jgi:hypothetical protein
MKVNWKPHIFHLHNEKKRNPFVLKLNQFTTKFKNVFDSHYQMHIRLTHNRSRRFHISVEATCSYQCGNKFIIRAHFSTYTYTYIWYMHRVHNNTSFIIVNPITSTMDSIIFWVSIFVSWKKSGKLWILNFVVCGILPDHLL